MKNKFFFCSYCSLCCGGKYWPNLSDGTLRPEAEAGQTGFVQQIGVRKKTRQREDRKVATEKGRLKRTPLEVDVTIIDQKQPKCLNIRMFVQHKVNVVSFTRETSCFKLLYLQAAMSLM